MVTRGPALCLVNDLDVPPLFEDSFTQSLVPAEGHADRADAEPGCYEAFQLAPLFWVEDKLMLLVGLVVSCACKEEAHVFS